MDRTELEAQKETQKERRRQLAIAVVEHLGWKLLQNDMQDNAVYYTDGTRAIRVGYDSYTAHHRLTVRTWAWPKYTTIERDRGNCLERLQTETVRPGSLYPRQADPSITVSADKSAEQIARDISRRFLPEYLRLWELCVTRAAELQDNADEAVAGWERICKAIGPSATDRRGCQYACGFRVQNRDGKAHVEGDLTPAQFERLIAAMGDESQKKS